MADTSWKVAHSSERDDWSTPQDFFDVVSAEFDLDLDVCAMDSSAKCFAYYTIDDDALTQPWVGRCWMNPPYGRGIGKWLDKAYRSVYVEQAAEVVACLVPAKPDTKWWWSYCSKGEVRFIPRRLRFGGASTGAPFPAALVVFERGRPASTQYWDWRL